MLNESNFDKKLFIAYILKESVTTFGNRSTSKNQVAHIQESRIKIVYIQFYLKTMKLVLIFLYEIILFMITNG